MTTNFKCFILKINSNKSFIKYNEKGSEMNKCKIKNKGLYWIGPATAHMKGGLQGKHKNNIRGCC